MSTILNLISESLLTTGTGISVLTGGTIFEAGLTFFITVEIISSIALYTSITVTASLAGYSAAVTLLLVEVLVEAAQAHTLDTVEFGIGGAGDLLAN